MQSKCPDHLNPSPENGANHNNTTLVNFYIFYSKYFSLLLFKSVYSRFNKMLCTRLFHNVYSWTCNVATIAVVGIQCQSCSCPQCGKHYKWRRNMLAHLKRECGQSPQLQCPFCTYRTKQRSNLKTHMGSRHSFILDSQDLTTNINL